MENRQQPPPAAREPAGSAPAGPQQFNILATIDLTDDYEPPPKVVVSNDRSTLPKPQIDLTQPGSSSQQNGFNSQQPGTSKPLFELKKQGPCMSCGISPCNWTFHNDCRHHLCKPCFARVIKPDIDPFAMSLCPVPYCKTPITDEVIKKSLPTDDYIFYLEELRDNLREALGAKADHRRPLENIQEEAEPNDIEEAVNGLCAGSFVNLVKEPAQTSSINVTRATAPKRRTSWLGQSNILENQPFFSNVEAFVCSICTLECEEGEGVMLKSCLHTFCKDCISDHVRHSSDAVVMCPGFEPDNSSCQCIIQDREIRAVVPVDVYDQYLQRSLKLGETNLDNVIHCQTPNCHGFVQANDANIAFACQVCNAINCVKCKAIHEQKTCEEHQYDVKNDVKNQDELKKTEEAVDKMIKKGEAMLCPNCGVLIQKDDGCDYITCTACKLGICYRTKKPRHPLEKVVNGEKIKIDGCHCNEKGKKCHPKCRNCH